MWAEIIKIKITKDLNYFSLCAFNLFNTQVSQFKLNSWNKRTFPGYSNILRCTCISHNIRENCWNIDKILCSQKSNLKEIMCRLWEFPPTPTFFFIRSRLQKWVFVRIWISCYFNSRVEVRPSFVLTVTKQFFFSFHRNQRLLFFPFYTRCSLLMQKCTSDLCPQPVGMVDEFRQQYHVINQSQKKCHDELCFLLNTLAHLYKLIYRANGKYSLNSWVPF